MILAILAIAFAFIGCGKKHVSASDPSSQETATYNDLVARLPQFEDAGWVVSRGQNTNQGDSLLFSGLALYALPCEAGNAIANAFEKQLATGQLVRYPGNKDAASLDGQLGMYRGIASRIRRCNERDRWHDVLAKANLGSLLVGYDAVRKSVLQNVGIGGGPSEAERLALEEEARTEAVAANAKHIACFRVHFSLIAMQTLEDLGGNIATRDLFCAESRGLRIPTVDHFCNRDDLTSYLDSYQDNVWIYQFQRCPGWESPDAKGDQEPGVDYLVAYQDKQLGL